MTKRIVASLALVLCMCAAPASSPADYNAFGITALQQLTAQSNSENVFISPVSIGVALSMAAEGAKGATRDQIIHALGTGESDLNGSNAALIAALTQNTDASVGLADAVWTRSDVRPRPEYLAALQQHYRAQAQALKFGDPSAAQTINDWTKAHTLGLIDRIVDQTSPSDFLYLTNALAFKGTWSQQFKKSHTHAAPFTNADGSKSMVQMMSQDADFETVDARSFRVLRMPYGNGGYAAYILLPTGDDVSPLVKDLSAGGFDTIVHGLHSSYMSISVPRFTANYAQDLVPLLKSMGITNAFTTQADFSGIHAVPPSLAINSVNHAAYVRVDEEGTTAAAATSVGITMTAIRIPQKTFVVDHPFVLALRDERTGSLLFIGAIRTLKA
ncbi:MAG TPA: serpin family protein [Candidatus Baltobacteraceae bacterium]|nr:serpin family protein [Candidatus Baltobacteraceae bacterium]